MSTTVAPEGRKLLRVEARNAQTPIESKPDWLRTRAVVSDTYQEVRGLVREKSLHTVCAEANCPNIYECWNDREATFLVGGEMCTRRCDFCDIATGRPTEYDVDEPRRVAVIGTRMPDGEGLAHVRRVTRELVGRGAVILSGLARGCDAEAHRTCLEIGGRGIAVVATGLDETYPRGHATLQRALLRQGGLVLSEYPPGSSMGRWQFVVRDRLLATLATEVLVVQCGLESGTLHTVRFARRYGVPCFAQQYEIYSEVSGGNQWLLREGLAQPHQLLFPPR